MKRSINRHSANKEGLLLSDTNSNFFMASLVGIGLYEDSFLEGNNRATDPAKTREIATQIREDVVLMKGNKNLL